LINLDSTINHRHTRLTIGRLINASTAAGSARRPAFAR
jgi:hypothetical protein